MSRSVSPQSIIPIAGLSPLPPFKLVVHPHVHVHLANVLMGQRPGLQVYEHEAPGVDVVEHQVDVEVLGLGPDVLLPGHEREPPSEFEQEALQVVEELQDERVLDEGESLGLTLCIRFRCVPAVVIQRRVPGDPVVVLGGDVPAEGSDAPAFDTACSWYHTLALSLGTRMSSR